MSPNHLSPAPSMYSTHTSSSEEVRQHRKRNSVIPAAAAAAGSTPSSYHRPTIFSYPTWSSSTQTLPQVRPLPDLGHDMPLLPPTAPFMKYNRGSKGSSSPSASRSRRGSFNSNNELVYQPLSPQTTGSSSRHHSSTAVPPPSRTKPERRPTNERRSSGDSTALSLHSTQHQQRPSTTSSKSQSVSRGRPSLPSQFLQTPSAWPGLPSQNGLMPMPMAMGYSPMNGYPVMFYPTGPMPTMQNVQMGSGGGRGDGNGNGWREPLVSWYPGSTPLPQHSFPNDILWKRSNPVMAISWHHNLLHSMTLCFCCLVSVKKIPLFLSLYLWTRTLIWHGPPLNGAINPTTYLYISIIYHHPLRTHEYSPIFPFHIYFLPVTWIACMPSPFLSITNWCFRTSFTLRFRLLSWSAFFFDYKLSFLLLWKCIFLGLFYYIFSFIQHIHFS